MSTSFSPLRRTSPLIRPDRQISHINTPSIVTGYDKENDGLTKTLKGADLVIIPAGVPRKPGMSRDDLFNVRPTSSKPTKAVPLTEG